MVILLHLLASLAWQAQLRSLYFLLLVRHEGTGGVDYVCRVCMVVILPHILASLAWLAKLRSLYFLLLVRNEGFGGVDYVVGDITSHPSLSSVAGPTTLLIFPSPCLE